MTDVPPPRDQYPAAEPYRDPAAPGQGYPNQGYPNQGYEPGGPATYAPPATYRKGGGMATAALVLGILALITSFTVIGGVLLGLIAIVLGFVASGRAKRGEAPGRGRAIAGIILGLLGLLLSVVLIVAGVSVLNSPAGKNLKSCLKSAGTNQAAVQNCQNQYRNQVTGN